MKKLLFPKQVYDCIQCGRSCQTWRILVDPRSQRTLSQTATYQQALQDGLEPVQPVVEPPGWFQIRPQGCCFLKENRCQIHSQHGPKAKPRTCRQFPFLPLQTPDGIFIGLSFVCRAVQQNVGQPLHLREEELQQLVEDAEYPQVGLSALPLDHADGPFIEWSHYLEREGQLLSAAEAVDGGELFSWLDQWGPLDSQSINRDWVNLLAQLEGPPHLDFIQTNWANQQNYLSPRFQIPVAPAILLQLLPQWCPPPLHLRYLHHLVQRKFLLWGPSLLARRNQLLAIAQLLSILSLMASPFETDSVIWAVDMVEGEVVTHQPQSGRKTKD